MVSPPLVTLYCFGHKLDRMGVHTYAIQFCASQRILQTALGVLLT
ncbi:unnamed protein product [Staurois parvus]|uniref:Uncharacterized protein n=1 Tax=Staurois parvus TaxID=386267 RepID=A0ABN9DVD5_9NEOB|nr:unnamed protein product [Staurois parvus]